MIFIALILYFLSCYNAYADTRPSAQALEWWLRKQGKFDNVTVRTEEIEEGTNRFKITAWEVPGIKKPTDQEVEQIIDEFESSKTLKASKMNTDKQTILQKLGLTEDEFKTLKELL